MMHSIIEAQMPTSPYSHNGSIGGLIEEHTRETTSTPDESLRHGTNLNYINVNASKSFLPCDFHRSSHLDNKSHCSGVQVHLHNHACHSTKKAQQPSPKHTCVPRINRPSHACGHDKKTTHVCSKPLKAPYPHSERCSINLNLPKEPENPTASDTPKRYHDSRYECYDHQSVPLHQADVTCHRVWGPPFPVWRSRPCGSGSPRFFHS